MAKRSKGKVIQMLSPENYIRQKARNLPVYECLVNANWEESKMADLIVARQHTNGNITVGFYLVDLTCLGVKDSFWLFNISMQEYRKTIENFIADVEEGAENIDYVLAHNIVYAGISFAEDYGFKPHKEFTSVTQYILDEDTDDVPLIEIECGFNGLPAYMQGSLDNDPKSRQVIAQLERVAGHGNYYLADERGRVINNDDDFDDDDSDEDDFGDMTFEEKGNEFLRYHERLDDELSDDESNYFFRLLQSIVDDLVDEDPYEQFYNELFDEINSIETGRGEIPDEMLGVEPGAAPLDATIKEHFLKVIEYGNDFKEMKRQFNLFQKNQGVEAAVDYLGLLISIADKPKKYAEKLKAASEKHPNYALIQLKWTKMRIIDENIELTDDFLFKPGHYFEGRGSIHPWERFCYLDMLTHYVLAGKDFNKLEAMKNVILGIAEEEEAFIVLYSLCSMFQIGIVADYINSKK
jgi:hypothetical protein